MKINYESEAYNRGWLAGHDDLVVALYNGFNGAIPQWLLTVIGGTKAVAEALKSATLDDMTFDRDYDWGQADGYDALLGEVEEAFKEQKIDMPTFLRENPV